MEQIEVSLSSDVAQRVRVLLLTSEILAPWRAYPDRFRVTTSFPAGERHDAGIDIHIEAIDGVKFPNPREVDVEIPAQCKKSNITITSGRISSGSPQGGTIRWFYRET